MATETGRPQDQGRRHRKRAADPAPEDQRLLDRVHEAMRADVEALLGELNPAPTGQATLDGTPDLPRLGITARTERWRLLVLLTHELASEVNRPPAGGGPSPTRARGPRKVSSSDLR